MKNTARRYWAWAPACALFLAGAVQGRASVTIDGTPNIGGVAVPGSPAGVLADGYSSTDSPYPSIFHSNFLVMTGAATTEWSDPIAFSTVPFTTIAGIRYFTFLFDQQETHNNEHVSLDLISISVGSTTVWSSTASLDLNPSGQPLTRTPLGNGSDMALFVPVSFFDGMNLTGSDTLRFGAKESLGNDGNEEWTLPAGLSTFGPNDPVSSVPEPSPATLLAIGAGLLAVPSLTRKIARR